MDCCLCGGSNREKYGKCPRCGNFDPKELAELKGAKDALEKEQAAHAETKAAHEETKAALEEAVKEEIAPVATAPAEEPKAEGKVG